MAEFKGNILIAIVGGYRVEDMRCLELNNPDGFWQSDIGWLIGDNTRDRPCGRLDKARCFKDFDEAVAFAFRKQQKQKKWRLQLLYEVDRYVHKVSSLDEILAIDAKLEADANEAELIRKEWRDRDMPECAKLEEKYGYKLGMQLAVFLGTIRNHGIEAAKAEGSTSTFYRLKKLLKDAGIEA